jgi:transcriptional regulator of acetoin/glycerol metabolism
VVGSSGSEEFIGTNGIGTVAEERRARMIVGPEHFAESLSGFTCVGAPIYHPLTRKLEGVVTLNSDVESASPLLTPLMTSTAHEIEQRMLDLASHRERMLLDTFLTANRAGGSVAVVSQDVLMAGPRAQRLLEGVDHGLIWEYVSEAVLAPHEGRASRAILIPTVTRVVALRCSPLLLDGRLAGALLEVDEGAEIAATLAPVPGGPGFVNHRNAGARGRENGDFWPGLANPVPGHSAPWQRVLEVARLQRTSGLPLVVVGEPGTGKLSLLGAMFGEHVRVLDCVAALNDRIGWLGRFREALAGDAEDVLVLRHLESVDDEIANAIASQLDTDSKTELVPRVVATAASFDWAEHPAQRRLLDKLAVARLDLPPLRERRDDIKELISQASARHAPDGSVRISEAAIQAMVRAPWPGNVRQLESIIRGLISSAGHREITVEMLPAEVGQYSSRRVLTTMEQVELDAIMAAVRNSNGNKVVAARLLGISRSTLYRKMRSYRLDPDKHFF